MFESSLFSQEEAMFETANDPLVGRHRSFRKRDHTGTVDPENGPE
jgi:hypothetical protein